MPRIINSAVSTSEAGVPTSYTVDSIILENHSGRQIDINALVTDFSVSESIYRPTVTLTASIRDTANILEEFEICGQEKITIELSRQDLGRKDKTKIKHVFYVTEYPVYGRNSSLVQAYKLRGVSEHAFNSKFKRISRALDGSAIDLVKNILRDDLLIDEKLIEVGSATLKTKNVKLIVPNMAPLDAISWILRRTFDQNGAPFYCFEKFGGGIKIISQTELIGTDNKPIRDYVDAKFFPDKSQTEKDYDQRLSRIINLSSDLKMSKFAAGSSGAFASTTRYLDLARKSYFEEIFDYTKDFKKMSWSDNGKMTVDPNYKIGKETKGISQKPEARYNDVALDGLAQSNYHAQTQGNILARGASHIENLDTFVHDLTVSGDLNVHAGLTIGLKLAKPIDPQVEVKNAESSDSSKHDTFMSGKHLIASTIHRFDTAYSLDLRLKRDTFNKELS